MSTLSASYCYRRCTQGVIFATQGALTLLVQFHVRVKTVGSYNVNIIISKISLRQVKPLRQTAHKLKGPSRLLEALRELESTHLPSLPLSWLPSLAPTSCLRELPIDSPLIDKPCP